MNRRFWLIAALALIVVVGIVGIASALGGDDEGEKLTGAAADRAKAAALQAVPGGKVEEVRREESDGDEEGEEGEPAGAVYEVEVKRPDGDEVELHLDGSYAVIGQAAEDEDDGDEDDD